MTIEVIPTHVVHVGPSISQVGGMETVLQSYESNAWREIDTSVIASSARTNPFGQARVFLAALKSCHSLPLDVALHCHLSQKGSFVREGILVIRESRRRKIFATIHGSSFVATARSRKWHRLYAIVLSRLSAIGVLNSAAMETVAELAPHVPVIVLPNPGPVRGVISPGEPEGHPRVVFAGRVGLRKGVDVLLAAWPQVEAAVPNAKLELLGPIDGELPEDVRADALAHHAGVFPADEVGRFLNGAACAVLPSRAEAQPMFLIEALGRGVPIVVTDVGGMPGLADGTGSVVPVDDPDALAAAMIVILSSREKAARMSEVALARYREEFSDDTHERNLIAFYSLA